MQSDFHDQMKMVKTSREFRWTMAKLVLLLDKALDKQCTGLTHFSKLIKDITKNENTSNKVFSYSTACEVFRV